jgi:hypothetical protein
MITAATVSEFDVASNRACETRYALQFAIRHAIFSVAGLCPIPRLFDPITVGDLRLPNRVIMAPLTTNRSNGIGRAPQCGDSRLLHSARFGRRYHL